MCTVSIVPAPGGFRLMCNRDERVARPLALAPRSWTVGGLWAAYPVDPPSGGTWLGVNETGLAVALMNRSRRVRGRIAPPESGVESSGARVGRSRGEIVPRLLGADSLTRVADTLRALDLGHYKAFRVVAAWNDRILIGTADDGRLMMESVAFRRPVVFTSSSLGDARAERARLPLFRTLVQRAGDPLRAQRAFHDHCWPDAAALSVRMCRSEARTVSRTTIDVNPRRTAMRYEVLPERS